MNCEFKDCSEKAEYKVIVNIFGKQKKFCFKHATNNKYLETKLYPVPHEDKGERVQKMFYGDIQ